MLSTEAKERLQTEPAQFVEDAIKTLASTSPVNRMPFNRDEIIFDEPLVGFADGDDAIFTDYKTIIAPSHFTPRDPRRHVPTRQQSHTRRSYVHASPPAPTLPCCFACVNPAVHRLSR